MEKKGYIILESVPEQIEKPKIITRSEGLDLSKDTFVIETVLQDLDNNRNKRKYTQRAIDSGRNHPMFREKISKNNLFGEAGHPSSDDIQRQSNIDHRNISHIIKKTWWEGNKLMGIVSAAHTEAGKDFEGLGRQGCIMPFSMRGLGGVVVKEGDITVVKDPLLIITWDWVNYPSHASAYQTGILKESSNLPYKKDFLLKEGVLIPCNYLEAVSNYVKEESSVMDTIDQLGLDPANAILKENNGELTMNVKTDDGRAVLFIEDSLKTEINNFFKKL